MRKREKSEYLSASFSLPESVYGNRRLIDFCSHQKHLLHGSSSHQITLLPPLLGSGNTPPSLWLSSLEGDDYFLLLLSSKLPHYPFELSASPSHCIKCPALWKFTVMSVFLVVSCLLISALWLCNNVKPGRQSPFSLLLSTQWINEPVLQRKNPEWLRKVLKYPMIPGIWTVSSRAPPPVAPGTYHSPPDVFGHPLARCAQRLQSREQYIPLVEEGV